MITSLGILLIFYLIYLIYSQRNATTKKNLIKFGTISAQDSFYTGSCNSNNSSSQKFNNSKQQEKSILIATLNGTEKLPILHSNSPPLRSSFLVGKKNFKNSDNKCEEKFIQQLQANIFLSENFNGPKQK